MSNVERFQARNTGEESATFSGQQLPDGGRHGDTSPQRIATAHEIDDSVAPRGLSPAAVRAQLQRVLESPSFEASERRKRFLRYVVEEMLAGRADRLKGYAIATAVFDRDDSFDAQTDPVVRPEARRLRRALEHYYLTAGRDDRIRIAIPKGGYTPICAQRESASIIPTAPSAGASDSGEAITIPGGLGRPHRRWLAAAGIAGGLTVALAVAVTTASSWLTRGSVDLSAAQEAMDQQLAAPAVVVAPFANLSVSARDERFAEGVTEELISDLTRFGDLRVYAVDALRQQGLADLVTPGQQPDVRYMVKGSVRRTANAMRMTVHLIDAGTGRYLWSESYERAPDGQDPVAVQKALGAELATRLAEPHGVVRQVTAGMLSSDRPAILSTYDCVSQAYAYRRTFSRDDYLLARACLEQAVRRDPSRPDAWAMLAFAHLDDYRWYGFGPLYRDGEALDHALAAAQRAKQLDRDNVLSLSAYAAVQYYRGALDEAEAAQRRALTLNSNDPELLAQLGWRIAFSRDWDQGVSMVRQAIERSRATDGWYFLISAFDAFRRDDCAATLADLARMGGTFFFISPALEAMCQAQLGNGEAARRALEEARARDPTFAKDPRGAFSLHRVPEDLIDRFMVGLRKAGLEDPAA